MKTSILLIDNYDSFVFNLARYLTEIGMETEVGRKDCISIEEVEELAPAAIVISPGPCTPAESGISQKLVEVFSQSIPILGVCLGHQAIATAFGGTVVRAKEPVHGRTSMVHHHSTGIFTNCPNPLRVGRYHSLMVEESSLPPEIEVTARTLDGTVMAIQHTKFPVLGVQFHPESVLTNTGHLLLQNFLKIAGVPVSPALQQGELKLENQNVATNDFYQREIGPDAWRPI